MKHNSIKIILLFILCCSSIIIRAQSRVDEKFELTSITFSLAGVPEYCQSKVPEYWDDVKKHFGPYSYTSQINFVRELNQIYGIGSIAVSYLTYFIEIRGDGIICLSQDYDSSKLQYGWTEQLVNGYVHHLNIFYNTTGFHDFFLKHTELYKKAENAANKIIFSLKQTWFDNFFAPTYTSIPDIDIVLSMINGPHNYAVTSTIVIGVSFDNDNQFSLQTDTESIIIHELCHHYANNVFKENWNDFKQSAELIYPHISEQMKKIGYNNCYTVFLEWFTDVCKLQYLYEVQNPYFAAQLSFSERQGFIWMRRTQDFMENFHRNRTRFPYISDYIPQLTRFLKYTSQNIELIKFELSHSAPYIINIYFDIEQNGQEIVLTFSEPMLGSYGFMGWPDGTNPIPIDKCEWIDECHFRITLNKCQTSKNIEYGIILNPASFLSKKYNMLNTNCTTLTF